MKKTITIKLSVDELLACEGDIVIELRPQASGGVCQSAPSAPSCTLFAFMEGVIGQLQQEGKARTVETYRTTLNSFRRFCQGIDPQLSALSAPLMLRYEQWLRQSGVKANSSSFYMRVLRAVYNRAVSQGLTADQHPFSKVYTGIARTTKRAVGIDIIRRLEALVLDDKKVCFARDMFMFSFYTQGMAFVDMAYLKKSDRSDGMLTYSRQKTNQPICVCWTRRMQQIVDRHPSASPTYLLPIIGDGRGTPRSKLRRCQYEVNEQLQQLSAMIGLQQKLTLYVARHSWASIAHSLRVPIDVISQGMGHSSAKTTHIYLKDIDNGRLAEANRQVQQLLD